jgi:hypothetical protein
MMHPRAARATVLATFFILAASAATAQSLTLKTVDFESASVGRPMKYNILLPRSYENIDAPISIGHLMSAQYEVMQRALGQRPFGRQSS